MTRDGRVVVPLRSTAAGQRRSAARHPSGRPPGHGKVVAFAARPEPAGSEPDTAESDGSEPDTAESDGSEPDAAQQATAPGRARRTVPGLDFLRRRLDGDYTVDEYGFDAELTDTVTAPLVRMLYDRWFRVEVNGRHHLPRTGGALLVANHAGAVWPWDVLMTALAVRTEHPHARVLRLLAGAPVLGAPVLGTVARRMGATLACHADAERLLRAGEFVGAWPEGSRGFGKTRSDRYRVKRFSDDGFVGAAAAAGVPIVPVSIVGSEETHPVLARVPVLPRLLGLPYLPVTPTLPLLGPLGLVPLPSKWYIEFGRPLPTAAVASSSDPRAAGDLADEVRDRIQGTVLRLLDLRTSAWH